MKEKRPPLFHASTAFCPRLGGGQAGGIQAALRRDAGPKNLSLGSGSLSPQPKFGSQSLYLRSGSHSPYLPCTRLPRFPHLSLSFFQERVCIVISPMLL